MSKENEDYLDKLLNSVQEVPQNPARQVKKNNVNNKRPMSSADRKADSFLADFEKELMESDDDDFLSDFEMDLEEDPLGDADFGEELFNDEAGLDKMMENAANDDEMIDGVFDGVGAKNNSAPEEPVNVETPAEDSGDAAETEDDFMSGLSAIMGQEDSNENATVEDAPSNDLPLEDFTAEPISSDESNSEESAEESGDIGIPDLSPDTLKDMMSDMAEQSDGSEAGSLDMGMDFGDLGFGDAAEGGEGSAPVGDDASADDIISMLNDLGDGDEDLKDIGSMLSADENGESIGITETEVAGDLAGLGFDLDVAADISSDDPELAMIKEQPSSSGSDDGEGTKKKGFLAKLKDLFFGSDEDEDAPQVIANAKQQSTSDLASELADEDADILRALEGGGDESGEETPAEPVLSEKEQKAKEKAEKKAAKKKEKEEKKKAKAAAKAAKPKKEKKPKAQKVKTKPLPKGPVFVILLLAGSILGITLFLSNTVNNRMAMSKAENYFTKGEYVNAYNVLNPLKLKDKDDKIFLKKVSMLASMEEFYRAYATLSTSGRQELALDALVRMIGHYDIMINDAGELGISAELTVYENNAEKLLNEVYNVSFEDALKLYDMRDRQEYSIELVKVLRRAGIQ